MPLILIVERSKKTQGKWSIKVYRDYKCLWEAKVVYYVWQICKSEREHMWLTEKLLNCLMFLFIFCLWISAQLVLGIVLFASDWWTATTHFCVITRQLNIFPVGGVIIVTKSGFNAQLWATLSAVMYDTTKFLRNWTKKYVFRFCSNCLRIVCPNHAISRWANKQRGLIWEPWFLKLRGHKGTVSSFLLWRNFGFWFKSRVDLFWRFS